MRRSALLLLLCLLALATGLACLRAAEFVAPPALPPPPPDRIAAAHVALVNHFYAAVNTALRTGETTMLEALVADDLIAHPPRSDEAFGRTAFLRHLSMLRMIFPDMEVLVTELQATTAGQVIAHVQVSGTESGTFLGLPVPVGVPAWPSLEVFRIEGDAIVEHWAPADVPVHLETLFVATRPAPLTGRALLQIARVAYPPEGAVPLQPGPDHRLTYVEEGTLTVPNARPPGLDPDARRTTIDVTAGTLVPAEPGLIATVSDAAPGAVLEVTILDNPPNITSSILKRQPDVTATVIASAIITVEDWPELTIAVGRVTLAPVATLAFPSDSGPILLVLESGELELTASAGRIADPGAWVVDPQASRSPTDDPYRTGRSVAAPIQNQVPVPVGGMALVEASATSLWHNPGPQPATVLVLVITPPEAVAQPSREMAATPPAAVACVESPGCR